MAETFDLSGWKLYIKSVHDGLTENFDRHKKYLKPKLQD